MEVCSGDNLGEKKRSKKVRHWSGCLSWKLPPPTPHLHSHRKTSNLSGNYSVKGGSGDIKPGSAVGGQDMAQKGKENNGVMPFINLSTTYLPSALAGIVT